MIIFGFLDCRLCFFKLHHVVSSPMPGGRNSAKVMHFKQFQDALFLRDQEGDKPAEGMQYHFCLIHCNFPYPGAKGVTERCLDVWLKTDAFAQD